MEVLAGTVVTDREPASVAQAAEPARYTVFDLGNETCTETAPDSAGSTTSTATITGATGVARRGTGIFNL
jgi:hypothetical protein